MYVDAGLSEEGATVSVSDFSESQMVQIIDRYQNSIRLLITLPTEEDVARFKLKEQSRLKTLSAANQTGNLSQVYQSGPMTLRHVKSYLSYATVTLGLGLYQYF